MTENENRSYELIATTGAGWRSHVDLMCTCKAAREFALHYAATVVDVVKLELLDDDGTVMEVRWHARSN